MIEVDGHGEGGGRWMSLGRDARVGYCTNVHAGETYKEILANLETHALRVKEIVSPDEPMGIGLWISAGAARQIVEERWIERLRDWLGERGLKVFTLNGFPHDHFHEEVVKDRVYRPDWISTLRVQYTHDLVMILTWLLNEGEEGSISTLPLGWPGHARWGERQLTAAAMQLATITMALHFAYEQDGRFIHLDIEPEPGCVLQTAEEAAVFLRDRLFPMSEGVNLPSREYVRICHDVCHAAVLFEDQVESLRVYERAGVRVGKVQVSSALDVDFDAMMPERRIEAMSRLAQFAEPRYLHQTTVKRGGREDTFVDLPDALGSRHGREMAGRWRVHFHVPIFLEEVGSGGIGTTRGEIAEAVRAARAMGVRHWEVETYAWEVLPKELRPASLAEGIARELSWFEALCRAEGEA